MPRKTASVIKIKKERVFERERQENRKRKTKNKELRGACSRGKGSAGRIFHGHS